MKVGLCIPYMKAGLSREDYLEWFRRIDEGPFHSLSCGERITGPTFDMRVLLSAAAAVTRRVEINATLIVLPMHSAVRVAKEVATLDVISGGRMSITVGVGGREKDYQALGAEFKGRFQRMDQQIATIKKVWAQQVIVKGAEPVGPPPLHTPRILAGVMGPKSMHRIARWADGIYAWSGNGEKAEINHYLGMADRAWQEAGRNSKPYRLAGFWYTLADNGQQQLYDYVYKYLEIAGPEIANMMAAAVNRCSADAVRAGLDNLEASGCEEAMLVPATADLAEIDRLAEIIASR